MDKTIASYILSTYSFIFSHSLDVLLRVGYIESEDAIPIPSFEENLLINLCIEAQNVFETESNLLEIDGDVIVVGDIHGSFHDLLRILKFAHEKRSKALFLGDYVDRGNFSLECITILFALKIMYPDTFYLIRGNHEFDSLCSQYGFKDEIINYHNPKKQKNLPKLQQQKDQSAITDESQKFSEFYANYKNEHCYKYSETLYKSFIQSFSYLPIAAVINKETFCVHGGLSPKFDHLDDINLLIHRPINEFEECSFLSDLLWSDPAHSPNCPFVLNTRGRGYLFNTEAVNIFLKKNLIKRIIRAHECVENGALKNFGDKLMTVFSASSYDKFTQNKSAIIQFFEKESKFKISTFPPLPRLQKSEAIYYKVQPLFNNNNDVDSINKSSSICSNKSQGCFSLLHPNLFASRTPPARTKQCCKASSQNFSPIRSCGTTNLVPHVRPKFITNRRQSFELVVKKSPPKLSKTPLNSDNEDVNEKIIMSNTAKRLPPSLYSFSDFVSDE